jgi:hypothetical protein
VAKSTHPTSQAAATLKMAARFSSSVAVVHVVHVYAEA